MPPRGTDAMPKAELHWAHDVLAVVVVGGISALVFWLVPPSEHAAVAAAPDACITTTWVSKEPALCNADIS
jgi:hypothetical protein